MLRAEFEFLDIRRGPEGVTAIVLNRPDKLNSITDAMHRELAEVFFWLARDKDTSVVVLTGAGRAFCAGGDTQWHGLERPAAYHEVIRDGLQIVQGILDMPQPIVARVNGPALGLGATIALHCDVIVASRTAYFGDPHVPNVGVAAGDGGASIWPFAIGPARAKRMLFTGERMQAEEAEALGLITEVCDDEALDERTGYWTTKLLTLPGLAVSYTKQSVNQWLRFGLTHVGQMSIALEGLTQASDDHQEAAAAFREHRPAKFTGA